MFYFSYMYLLILISLSNIHCIYKGIQYQYITNISTIKPFNLLWDCFLYILFCFDVVTEITLGYKTLYLCNRVQPTFCETIQIQLNLILVKVGIVLFVWKSVRFFLFSLRICFNISALQHPQDVFVKKKKMKTDLKCSRQQKTKLESLNVREPVDQFKDLRFIVSISMKVSMLLLHHSMHFYYVSQLYFVCTSNNIFQKGTQYNKQKAQYFSSLSLCI